MADVAHRRLGAALCEGQKLVQRCWLVLRHNSDSRGSAMSEQAHLVLIPLATQQYLLLRRNLVYTGITRGKKLVVLIGQRRGLAMAVRNNRTEQRFSGLLVRLLVPG